MVSQIHYTIFFFFFSKESIDFLFEYVSLIKIFRRK